MRVDLIGFLGGGIAALSLSLAFGANAQEAAPADLLTTAEGAVLVSASANPAAALALLDGAAATLWSNGGPKFQAPFVFVFELRAPTTVAAAGVANAGPRPGGVAGAAAGEVLFEGSPAGPDRGFVRLAELTPAESGETLVEVTGAPPVRWIRLTVEGSRGQAPWTYLGEAIIRGTQDFASQPDRFTGVFAAGRNAFIELAQSGGTITGCYVEQSGKARGEIWGDEVDGVARLSLRSDKGILGSAVLTIDSRGSLAGVRYRDRSRMAWGGPPAPKGTRTPCSETPAPANPVADAIAEDGRARLYGILFDYDRDSLKPASEPALRQLLAALEGGAGLKLEISGHTDSHGPDDYNLDLSRRRAGAVVAWLVNAGVDPARLIAIGEGERKPVAGNDTADGRALNRRVEARRI